MKCQDESEFEKRGLPSIGGPEVAVGGSVRSTVRRLKSLYGRARQSTGIAGTAIATLIRRIADHRIWSAVVSKAAGVR